MKPSISIRLIGDYNAAVVARQAIPRALALAGDAAATPVHYARVPTQEIGDESTPAIGVKSKFLDISA
jgi:hypothetical protein